MSDAGALPPTQHLQRIDHYGRLERPAYHASLKLFIDACWIVFIIGASSALFFLRIPDVERYFWLPADLAIVAFAIGRHQPLLRAAQRHWVFMSWPLLACVSSLWSTSPTVSLYHGIQLLMTIMLGLLWCTYASLERILPVIFTALLATAIMSIGAVFLIPGKTIGSGGEWLGVFPHKNVLGHMMTLLIITSVCLLLQGWRPFVSAGGVVFGIALLILSSSGTALAAALIALVPLPLAVTYRWGWFPLMIAVGLMLIIPSLVLFTLEVNHVDLVDTVLTGMNKDATLTGRTILWDYGIEAYNSRPWLGFGYKGYWESPNTGAAYLRFVIGQDLWFFHNNFVDTAVAFGTIGPIVLAGGLCVAFFAACRKFAASDQFVSLWPVLFIVFVTVLACFENPLFQNHSLHQFLLIVAVAATVRGDPSAPDSNGSERWDGDANGAGRPAGSRA